MEELKGLTPGRIVHWSNGSEHYPAMIIKVAGKQNGDCILRVFGQFIEDDERIECSYDADFKPNTWHWIERE